MTDDIDRSHHDHENAEPGPHTLPAPPIDPEANLRKLPWMPLHIGDLKDSDFWRTTKHQPEVRIAALNLWMAAWHQVPAGSLPDDAAVIAAHAGYDLPPEVPRRTRYSQMAAYDDRTLIVTMQIVERALSGFVLCADRRWYHIYLAKQASEKWEAIKARQGGAAKTNDKLRKERRKKRHDERTPTDRPPNGKRRDERTPIAVEGEGELEGESSLRERAHDDAPLRSQTKKQAPAPPAESGSAQTERDPRLTPKGQADPRPQPEPQTSNAGFIKEFGMTPNALVDALHQAAGTGANPRMGRNLISLENGEAIITLIRSTPGLSFREDVLPAIAAAVMRPGSTITSWRYFRDPILAWHQNRVKGVSNGGSGVAYDPEKIRDNWYGRDEGVPPPGWGPHLTKPWKQKVIDERTGEPRRYGGRWDWEWLDAVERFQRDGTWHEWFAAELPGRPGSSCPDDICAHFGIVPQARQPNVVVPLVVGKMPLPSRRAYVPPPEVFARQARAMTNGSEELMGDVPSQTAGHSLEGDEAPPF